MEDDVQKWCVTYTKHVKQKRKVYQDGILHYHSSNHKAKLLDECDKVLEIRILKKDEVVESGVTVTFNGYLVDVGQPDGGHKSIPNENIQGNEKKFTQNSGFMERKKFTPKPVFADMTNNGLNKNEVRNNNLTPSQNIIREFKKSEENKYGTMQSSTEPTRSGPTEWQVLYTTQKTQKAKKYHDGVLRLKYCGTQGRQAKLFDESDQLLAVKSLKNSEAIKPSETMIIHAYLVDIGEPKGDHKPMTIPEVKCQGNDKKPTQKSRLLHQQLLTPKSLVADNVKAGLAKNKVHKFNQSPSQKIIEEFKKKEMKKYGAIPSSPDPKFGVTEWHVLYTTQITQKSKKYHDGILQLHYSGSQGRQAKLYDANEVLLDSRFLKKDEVIESSTALKLDGHLVEIGEPVKNSTSSSDNVVQVQSANYNETRQTGVFYEHQRGHQANRNTVSLLNEDNPTHSSKLKLSKEVKSENILEPPNKSEITYEVASQGNVCGGKDPHSSSGRSQAGEIRTDAYLSTDKVANLGLDRVSSSLHSAHTIVSAILSILKRPMPQECKTTRDNDNQHMERNPALKFFNSGDTDLKDQVRGQALRDLKRARSPLEDCEGELQILDEETSTYPSSRSKIANTDSIHGNSASVIINLEKSDGKELQSHNYHCGGQMSKGEELECSHTFNDFPSFDLGF